MGRTFVTGDTHKKLIYIDGPMREVENYIPVIESGVLSIMVAHIGVQNNAKFDTQGLPSTCSEKIVTTLLRDSLGFKGLIITDAMNMGGVVSVPQAASKAVEEAFGKKPIPTRDGGSIPIVAMFEQELGLKTILMGFGLDSDAIHSPNEHFGVFNYLKGIETIPLFYKYFTELSK